MSEVKENQFLDAAFTQVPRLLGQLNRNPSSKSYGSFDRTFWHYRTNDISCCRYQEGVYTLTLLYCLPFEGNGYYRDQKVFEWVRAALRFTATIQRTNGSFDEWYLNEGSYVGTAFLTAALSQTVLLLQKYNIELPESEMICTVIEKGAGFLASVTEQTVLNQVSGAVFALAAAGTVLRKENLVLESSSLLDSFIEQQNKEGWWSEYGGPDIGYLSLTISYLGKYRELINSKQLERVIAKAREFIESFIHPDGTAGGEYMSRNTEYLIPSVDLPYLGAVQPQHLDDRYLCYILYNWIEAGVQASPEPFPHEDRHTYFPESSTLSFKKPRFHFVVNGKKGGSFRLYNDGKVYYDTGLEIKIADEVVSTGVLDTNNSVEQSNGHLRVIGFAKALKEPLMVTKVMILFKTWQFLFGRFRVTQRFLKKFLRRRMISYSGTKNVKFERIIDYSDTSVVIQDIVHGGVSTDAILFGAKSAYTAVPSSKYVAVPEIDRIQLKPQVEMQQEDDKCSIRRIFTLNG